MMMAQIAELDGLSAEQVVEAANGILAAKLGIDDPAEAAQRVAALAGLDPGKSAEIASLARKAAESDPALVGELLASSLDDLADSEPQMRETIKEAARAAGEKQTVVGLDILVLGFLLLCGYIAVKNRGVENEESTMKIQEQKDGRLEVTISHKKKLLNPLSPVGALIGRIWSKPGG
jgi:hypothetical protein